MRKTTIGKSCRAGGLIGLTVFGLAGLGCGDRDGWPGPETSSSADPIQNGQVETGYPAVGAILVNNTVDAAHLCAGTLIAPSYVLTAEHCMFSGNVMTFNTGTDVPNWVHHEVDQKIQHPTRDLLIAHLTSPIMDIAPAVLGDGSLPGVGTSCTAVGSGTHNVGNNSSLGLKRSATVQVTSATSDTVAVQAVTGIPDEGDSGGPLSCNGSVVAVVRDHVGDPPWPNHTKENYTPIDAAWIASVLPPAAPPPYDASGVTGDFNGDGKADVMVFYDDSPPYGEAGLWVFPGTTAQGDTATAPYRVFHGGPNSFDVKASKVAAGDFNGDGLTDVLVLYDYGMASAGLFVFPGTTATGDTASQPYRVWHADAGTFDVKRTKVTAGDFDHDGKADLLVLFDYGNASTGLIVFPGSTGRTDSASVPYRAYFGGPNSFDVNRAKVTAGDFNHDGKADVIALYNYAGAYGEAGVWIFPGTTGKTDGSSVPYRVYNGGPNSFDVNAAKVAGGDFNGDGFADLLVLYDYGSASAGLFVFPGTTGTVDGSSLPVRVWHAPAGNFNVAMAKFTAGDFTHDGKADVMMLYDYSTVYGPGSAGLFVFYGNTGTTDAATSGSRVWFAGPGSFDVLQRSRVP
ncbi:MAG TPA: FG-GAP-like repeat-containing protein [Kofleriaceae bacterium]|jgi:hypothetical protein